MIRRATTEDLGEVVRMAREFHTYSPWVEVPFDEGAVRTFAQTVIETGAVFLSEDGMCGGTLYPAYFNPAFRIAMEFCWWAPSGDNGLRAAFEKWAREEGANAVQFSALGNDRLPAITRLYKAAGYEATDTSFIKRLS